MADKSETIDRLKTLSELAEDSGGEFDAAAFKPSFVEAIKFVEGHEFKGPMPLSGMDHDTGHAVLEFHGDSFGSLCFDGRGLVEIYINDGQKSVLFTSPVDGRKARNILTRLGVHELPPRLSA